MENQILTATQAGYEPPPRPGPPPSSAWLDDVARRLMAEAMIGGATGWRLITAESRPRARAYVRRLRHLSSHMWRETPVRLSIKHRGNQLWVRAEER